MATEQEILSFRNTVEDIRREIGKEIIGQQDVVEHMIMALVAGGNVLLEGVPGLGKTRLVRTLSHVLDLPFSRIQFTPDLMPADITGTNIIVKTTQGNVTLRKMGLQGVPWLEDRRMAMVSVLVLTGWHGVGYGMMIYLSAMLGISRDYFEAAELDGASGVQTFRYITLPLLSPTTLFLLITTFISSMKVFQSVDVLTGGGPYNSTEVFVYYIYRLAFRDFRIDRASVNALLFFVILLVVTASTIRITNKNVHYDA